MSGATPTIPRRARGIGDKGVFYILIVSTRGRGIYVARRLLAAEELNKRLFGWLFVCDLMLGS